MTTTAEHIDTIITNAITQANTASDNASTAAQEIHDVADGYYYSAWSGAPTLPDPEAIEPDMFYEDDAVINFDAILADLIALLSSELSNYFSTYYPLSSDAFDEAQDWLENVIENGGTGIPAAIEDAIVQRDKDRLTNEALSVQNQILNGAAARGIYYPDGPASKRTREAQYKRLSEVGKQSTTVAVRQSEIEIETIKMAVTLATQTRLGAMQAATDYIRALATAFDTATDVTQLNPNAKAKMMEAVGNLYRARLSRDELIINRDVTKRGQNRQYWNDYQNTYWNQFNSRINALAQEAEVYARIAQSSLSALQTIASTATSSFS